MRVRLTRSIAFEVGENDYRFIPRGMEGDVMSLGGSGDKDVEVLVCFDLAFAEFPAGDADGDGPMQIAKCESLVDPEFLEYVTP